MVGFRFSKDSGSTMGIIGADDALAMSLLSYAFSHRYRRFALRS